MASSSSHSPTGSASDATAVADLGYDGLPKRSQRETDRLFENLDIVAIDQCLTTNTWIPFVKIRGGGRETGLVNFALYKFIEARMDDFEKRLTADHGCYVKKTTFVEGIKDGVIEIRILHIKEDAITDVFITCKPRRIATFEGILAPGPIYEGANNSYQFATLPIFVFDKKIKESASIIKFADFNIDYKEMLAGFIKQCLFDDKKKGDVIDKRRTEDGRVIELNVHFVRKIKTETIPIAEGSTEEQKVVSIELTVTTLSGSTCVSCVIYICTKAYMDFFMSNAERQRTYWERTTNPYILINTETSLAGSYSHMLEMINKQEKLIAKLQTCSPVEKEKMIIKFLAKFYQAIVDTLQTFADDYKQNKFGEKQLETVIVSEEDPRKRTLFFILNDLTDKLERIPGISEGEGFRFIELIKSNLANCEAGIKAKFFQDKLQSVSQITKAFDCPSIDFPTEFCAYCGKLGENGKALLLCSICRQIQYCCKQCQKDDWKRHKKECNKLTAGSRIVKRKRKTTKKSSGKIIKKKMSRRNH